MTNADDTVPLRLPRVAARLFGTPLMVHPGKLQAILAGLGPRLGVAPAMEAAEEEYPAAERRPARRYAVTPDGVAVVPVVGGLVARAGRLDAQSMEIRSYAAIGRDLRAAVADGAVRAIVLDIDSPGGESSGALELAEAIRGLRGPKPIVAVANHGAYSAAYAIASAADRILVPPSGGVGSIGVVGAHLDVSRAEDQAGLTWTFVAAGARKLDFNPHMPLSDDARGVLEAEVARLYDAFVAAVAAGRGLPPAAVRATEAGLFFGADAVAAGLADQLGTYDDALREAAAMAAARGARVQNPERGRSSARGSPKGNRMDTMEAAGAVSAEGAGAPVTTTTTTTGPIDTAAIQAEADRKAAERASAIAALCELAGMPERAAAFLREGKTEAEVRDALLRARAEAGAAGGEVNATRPPAAGVTAGPHDAPTLSPGAVAASWDRVGQRLFGQQWKGF